MGGLGFVLGVFEAFLSGGPLPEQDPLPTTTPTPSFRTLCSASSPHLDYPLAVDYPDDSAEEESGRQVGYEGLIWTLLMVIGGSFTGHFLWILVLCLFEGFLESEFFQTERE